MKKDTKKEFSKDELERHVGAILEEVKDGFKVQLEYSEGINQRLDKIEKTLNSHTQMIGSIMVDVSVSKEEVSEINEKLEVHDKKLASI